MRWVSFQPEGPFPGVSKCFLQQYVAIFQWCHNLESPPLVSWERYWVCL